MHVKPLVAEINRLCITLFYIYVLYIYNAKQLGDVQLLYFSSKLMMLTFHVCGSLNLVSFLSLYQCVPDEGSLLPKYIIYLYIHTYLCMFICVYKNALTYINICIDVRRLLRAKV